MPVYVCFQLYGWLYFEARDQHQMVFYIAIHFFIIFDTIVRHSICSFPFLFLNSPICLFLRFQFVAIAFANCKVVIFLLSCFYNLNSTLSYQNTNSYTNCVFTFYFAHAFLSPHEISSATVRSFPIPLRTSLCKLTGERDHLAEKISISSLVNTSCLFLTSIKHNLVILSHCVVLSSL